MISFLTVWLKKLTLLSAVTVLLLFPMSAFAQGTSPGSPSNVATIISPPLNQSVAPLDTLILVRIDKKYIGTDFYYLIVLDEKPVTARWNPDTSTFSYYPERMLEQGAHTIKVFMTEVGGVEGRLVAQGTFIVGDDGFVPPRRAPNPLFDLGARARPTPVVTRTSQPPPRGSRTSTETARFTGRTSVDISSVDINGLGSSLRQEPRNTSVFDIRGTGATEETDFDFRFYMTTDESRYEQPRNRYSFQVQQPDFSFWVGDTSPRFNPLTIDGMRVRGVYGSGSMGPVTFYLAQGQLRRGTETRYDADGRLMRRGVGPQDIWVTRIGLLEDSLFSIGLTYLSAEEDAADLENVGDPGENTIRSLDFLWRLDGDNTSLRGVWAESDYNFDDPGTDNVVNAQAREFEFAFNTGGHTVSTYWQMVDPGFTTLGRLALIDDREKWGIEDRLRLFDGALTGRLYWERYHNNLSDLLSFTTSTLRYGGQLRYRIASRGPTLTLGYTRQDRWNSIVPGESSWFDENIKTMNLGIMQTFNCMDARHDIRVDWRSVDRNSIANATNESIQQTITVTLTSRWTRGFQLNTVYGSTDSDYTGRDTHTNIDRYSIRAAYTPPSRDFSIWGKWEGVDSSGSQLMYNSNRRSWNFGLNLDLRGDFRMEASARFMEFDDRNDNANDYTERTYRVLFVQMLN